MGPSSLVDLLDNSLGYINGARMLPRPATSLTSAKPTSMLLMSRMSDRPRKAERQPTHPDAAAVHEAQEDRIHGSIDTQRHVQPDHGTIWQGSMIG